MKRGVIDHFGGPVVVTVAEDDDPNRPKAIDGHEFVGLGRPSQRAAQHLLQADSTQSAHVRLDLSLLRLAQARLDEDPPVPGARELVPRRAGRRQRRWSIV
jgi:hypothetical protein